MGVFHLKPSFAGGELTPSLYGRIDLQKYDVGAATLENAVVQRYGGVTRRPGFVFIGQTKGNRYARLIPFSYNAEQNYVLEFTNHTVRVLQNGEFVTRQGFPVEIQTPYTTADLPQIKYAQSADMLFLAHPNHHPAIITRTLDGWEFHDLSYKATTTTEIIPIEIDPSMHVKEDLTEIKNLFFPAGQIYDESGQTTTYQTSKTGRSIGGQDNFNVVTIETAGFPSGTRDIWFRVDIYRQGAVDYASPVSPYRGQLMVYFDDEETAAVGYWAGHVWYYNDSGTYVKPNTEYFQERNCITKTVLHVSTSGVWLYYNDELVFSIAERQGSRISHIRVSTGQDRYSNIIIADFDCSALTMEYDDTLTLVEEQTTSAITEDALMIKNGPFDDPNTTDITIKPSGTSNPYNRHIYTNVGKKDDLCFPYGVTVDADSAYGASYPVGHLDTAVTGQQTANYTSARALGLIGNMTEAWIRFDICVRSLVDGVQYSGAMAVEFDNNSRPIGYAGLNISYIDSTTNRRTTARLDPDLEEHVITKVVVHAASDKVEIFVNNTLRASYTGHQGNKVTGFFTGAGASCWMSNIIIADFDCSDMSLENEIDIEDGTITLTASDDLFEEDMIGQLLRLTHTVPAQYAKGVPTPYGEGLIISCVPGASVYVESFGFWNGTFEVWEKDDLGQWILLRKQSGNRSSNYNMTFQNDDEVIRWYGVASNNDFDNSEKEGEDPDQRGYITIQSFSNDYDGIVRIKEIISPTQAKAVVIRELASTDETLDWAFQAWSKKKGYPAAVGFFEDRLVFAGSPKHPQTYWTSRTGSYLDFGISYPQKDDDAITGTLATGQMNGIKAIIPFDEMIMLTTGGEYRVGGGGQNFTPTTQQARAQEYRGINDVTPVVIGGRIIYVQFHGSVVRDLAYSYDVDKYSSGDVSLLAYHLFDGHEIVSMTYQQTPDSVVWCVRSDGTLLGMTYIKEQDVYAWHKHTTQGQFVDVCSIPGDVEDELYAVIRRGHNYYIERMARREENIYVDAASADAGAWWLAGETVQEGENASGLGYTTTVTMLPLEINAQDGTTGSRKKRIQRMCVMFRGTKGGKFGFEGYSLDPIKYEGNSLFDGKKFVSLPHANYEETLMLKIVQDSPYPMTILSIIPEVLQGG